MTFLFMKNQLFFREQLGTIICLSAIHVIETEPVTVSSYRHKPPQRSERNLICLLLLLIYRFHGMTV